MKLKNLLIGTFTILNLIGCGGSDESTVKKYLLSTYTREHKKQSEVGFGYDKEITIQHLKGNEFRFTCVEMIQYTEIMMDL